MKDDAKRLGAFIFSILMANRPNINKVANSIDDDVLLPPEKIARDCLREAP
jgi:hypothetical protein